MKKIVFFVLATYAALLVVLHGPRTLERALDVETRLGLFEERISNIPAEFIRRSPRFAKSWENFKGCMQYEDACDPRSILRERDRSIAAEWPEIFDRLVVFNDWGANFRSARSRDRFFETLREKGRYMLRNRCVPKITYIKLPRGNVMYQFEGYKCSQEPATAK